VYNIAFAKAQVASSWLSYFESLQNKVEQLRKLLDEPEKNYAI